MKQMYTYEKSKTSTNTLNLLTVKQKNIKETKEKLNYFPIQYLKVLAFTIVAEDWATNRHQNGLNINKYKTNIDKLFKICLLSNIILLNCF